MTHDEVREVAPEYLLGELDDATRNDVAAHLQTCDSCREDVRALAVTLDALGRAVPEAAPPAALRARVLAVAAGSMGRVLHDVRPRDAVARWVPWFVAAAASVAAVAALVQVRSTRVELQQLRSEVAALRQAASATEAVRASLEQRLEQRDREAAVLRAADLVRFDLAGQAPAAAAHARAYVSPSVGVYFTAEGLPQLSADKIYQLWVIVAGKPVSAGIFAPDPSGRADAVLTLPANLGRPAVVAVTPEPAGGLPAPSGPMYLVGKPSV